MTVTNCAAASNCCFKLPSVSFFIWKEPASQRYIFIKSLHRWDWQSQYAGAGYVNQQQYSNSGYVNQQQYSNSGYVNNQQYANSGYINPQQYSNSGYVSQPVQNNYCAGCGTPMQGNTCPNCGARQN